MLRGFFQGVIATPLRLIGVFFVAVWIFSGFYNVLSLVLGFAFFGLGQYMAYLSRQTVKVVSR